MNTLGRHDFHEDDLLLIPMIARWPTCSPPLSAAEEALRRIVDPWDHLRDPDGNGDPGLPEA